MWSKLSELFTSLQKGFLKNVLTGSGLMIGTTAITMSAFDGALNSFKNSVDGVHGDVLALAHLSGIDLAISIVLGAVVTRIMLNNGKLTLKKA